MKSSSQFIWASLFTLASCSSPLPEGVTERGLLATQASAPAQIQEPWQLSIVCLPEQKLRGLVNETPQAPVNPLLTTVALKLRLQSQHAQTTIPALLATQAPQYSAAQAQDALFYHMAEAGYLQIQDEHLYPQAAYTEMTTQRERCVDLVFVFSLPRRLLAQKVPVKFVLDKAFFLARPVEFVLSASQLLPAS